MITQIVEVITVLRIIISLISAAPLLEQDIAALVEEIRKSEPGAAMLRAAVSGLRKLADDIDQAL